MCFNVNGGLSEKVKIDGFLERMNENDVVFLSETWSNRLSDLDVLGFKRISKFRDRKKYSKRDSGGLEVYIKEKIFGGIREIEWDNEDGLCLQFNKLFFGWDNDLIVFFVYFSPINSSRNDINVGDNYFEKLLNKLSTVDGDCVKLICGDLNSRVGTRQECILYNQKDLQDQLHVFENDNMSYGEESTFTEFDFINNNMSINRVNSDQTVNEYGNKLIDFCRTCDMAILNGRAGSDKYVGATTFVGKQGESTIDLVLEWLYTSAQDGQNTRTPVGQPKRVTPKSFLLNRRYLH